MRAATAFLLIGLLVLAVACVGKPTSPVVAPPQPPAAGAGEPVVDAFDAGLQDPVASEDTADLESLDSDLAGFE